MRMLFTAALVAVFLWPFAAAAQPPCQPRDRVIELLAARYREAPVAMGINKMGALVEVLTSADGATWTIVVTTPAGMSCIVAAGEGWRGKPPTVKGEGA